MGQVKRCVQNGHWSGNPALTTGYHHLQVNAEHPISNILTCRHIHHVVSSIFLFNKSELSNAQHSPVAFGEGNVSFSRWLKWQGPRCLCPGRGVKAYTWTWFIGVAPWTQGNEIYHHVSQHLAHSSWNCHKPNLWGKYGHVLREGKLRIVDLMNTEVSLCWGRFSPLCIEYGGSDRVNVLWPIRGERGANIGRFFPKTIIL